MEKFPKAAQILANMEGVNGAVVFNFATQEILIHVDKSMNLNEVIPTLSETISRYQTRINQMSIYDLMENIVMTTQQHYHIIHMVPQFDTVAIYLVVTRYIMLSYITKQLENVIYSMH